MQLKREELKKIKQLAQRGDYNAVVAIVDHHIAVQLDKLVNCTSDHRFVQGNLKALTQVRSDIVINEE